MNFITVSFMVIFVFLTVTLSMAIKIYLQSLRIDKNEERLQEMEIAIDRLYSDLGNVRLNK